MDEIPQEVPNLGLDYIRSRLDCQTENHVSEGSQSSEEEDFFSSLKRTGPLEMTQQLDTYLGCPEDTVEMKLASPGTSQKAFIRMPSHRTESNQTRHRKRKRLGELKKKLGEKIIQYNTVAASEDKIDTEAACSLSDVVLPWEAQGDDEFVISPSLAKLEKCKKADLLIVASCYNVHVPYSIGKAELKQLLWSKLVEQGVLPRPAGDATDAVAGDAAGDALEADVKAAEVAAMLAPGVEPGPVTDSLMGGGMTTEDLRIALQKKKVENRNKQLEVQAMHLRIRVLEL
ncbi:hypothetical protein JOB18_011250 [Solea senegalensis]|uniref:Uncharacterized protein n=1 Tax=Solea senegalensis TaxID=28829 RepID=A0AAV6RWQ4_SOLSE|nr:hypothetical protein JOB18_011250 [Solea senegalensis]